MLNAIEEEEPDDCPGCSVPCASLLGLPALVLLFLGGRTLYFSARNPDGATRAVAVGKLRAAVATWEHARPALAATRYRLRWTVPGRQAESFVLEPSSATDSSERLKDGADVPKWTPLRFQASLPIRTWGDPLVGSLRFSASGPRGNSSFALDHIEFTQMIRSRSPNWKQCVHQRHGAWQSGNCSVARVLTEICFAVDLDVAGGVSPHGVGTAEFGCRMVDGRWHALSHRTVPRPRVRSSLSSSTSASLSLNTTLHPSVVRLTLRSSLDPHFVALNLTKGSMRIGATPQEQARLSIVFLFLGSCLGLPPLVLFCMARCNKMSAAGRGSAFASVSQAEEQTLPPRKANL